MAGLFSALVCFLAAAALQPRDPFEISVELVVCAVFLVGGMASIFFCGAAVAYELLLFGGRRNRGLTVANGVVWSALGFVVLGSVFLVAVFTYFAQWG